MKNKNLRNALMKMQGMENSNSEIEIINPEKANVLKGGLIKCGTNSCGTNTVCNAKIICQLEIG